MKEIAVNEVIKTFEGEKVVDVSSGKEDKSVLIKDVLYAYVNQFFVAQNKLESLLAYSIAEKMYKCTKGKLVLKDDEFAILERAVEKPHLSHSTLLMGPVYKAMDAAKPVQKGKRGKKKEVKKKVGLAAVDLRVGADV